MDGAAVIAVHPQLQLLEAVGPGLVDGQLHQVAAQTAAPILFPDRDAHYGTMAVFDMRPQLCNAKLPHQRFSGKSAHLKVHRAFPAVCKPILHRFQIRAFFRVAGHKIGLAVGRIAECIQRLSIVRAQAAHRQHFPVGQSKCSGLDLHILLSSSFDCSYDDSTTSEQTQTKRAAAPCYRHCGSRLLQQ